MLSYKPFFQQYSHGLETMFGPVAVQAAEKKARQERKKDKIEAAVAPDKIEDTNNAQLGEVETSKRVELVSLALKKWTRRREREGDHLDFFEFVVNPTSFSQTVENIFHLSFLIKKGFAKTWVADNRLLLASTTSNNNAKEVAAAAAAANDGGDNDSDGENYSEQQVGQKRRLTSKKKKSNGPEETNQCIVSLDMASFQSIVDQYDLAAKKPLIDPRADITSDEYLPESVMQNVNEAMEKESEAASSSTTTRKKRKKSVVTKKKKSTNQDDNDDDIESLSEN